MAAAASESQVVAAAAAPAPAISPCVKVRRVGRTNRSRLVSAIKCLAKGILGDRKISQKSIDMLEDIMNYTVKEVMNAAASLCSGSKKSTATGSIMINAFMLVFRHSSIQKNSHSIGDAAVARFKAARQSSKQAKASGGKAPIVKLSGGAGKSAIGRIMSVGRVGIMLKRYMIRPCTRVSEDAVIYATGFLENFFGCVIKSAETFVKEDHKCATLKAKHVAMALTDDAELRGIVPAELVVKFNGKSSGVKRKRSGGDSDDESKKKKKRR